MKICVTCEKEKLDDDFNWKNKAKGQRQYSCRQCTRIQSKRSYDRNKESTIQNVKLRNDHYALILSEWKRTLSCVVCNESAHYCLDFHHLDPSKKDINISSISRGSWKRLRNEILKCVVVCSNCHRKIHQGDCLLYTSPSPRDRTRSRMPSSA